MIGSLPVSTIAFIYIVSMLYWGDKYNQFSFIYTVHDNMGLSFVQYPSTDKPIAFFFFLNVFVPFIVIPYFS